MKAHSSDGDGNNGSWYGYEGLSSLLQIYVPNVQTLMPATTLGGLKIQLNKYSKRWPIFHSIKYQLPVAKL